MSEEKTALSRREMFGAAAVAGLATAARAQEKHEPRALTSPLAAGYPKPPFPQQRQPWPALQSKMTPRPDCGETS